jgi:hypothetical protein
MSNRKKRAERADRSGDVTRNDADAPPGIVGYGQPPVATRFKPGSSGNPKGRPKGSQNLKTLIKQAMTARISVQEGTTTRRVSKIEGVVLRQLQSALKGSDKAAVAVIRMATQLGFLEDNDAHDHGEATLSGQDEQILNELISRARKG